VTRHDEVVCVQLVGGGGGWFGCVRGKKLGRLGLLRLSCVDWELAQLGLLSLRCVDWGLMW
jgi:hypothetical protein